MERDEPTLTNNPVPDTAKECAAVVNEGLRREGVTLLAQDGRVIGPEDEVPGPYDGTSKHPFLPGSMPAPVQVSDKLVTSEFNQQGFEAAADFLRETVAEEAEPIDEEFPDLDTIGMVGEFHAGMKEPPDEQDDDISVYLQTQAFVLAKIGRRLHEYAKRKPSLRLLRCQLMVEELAETVSALAVRDMLKLFDGLLDMRYVNDGTIKSYYFHTVFYTGFERVHAANMAKGNKTDSAGRRLKPEGWQPPVLSDLVVIADGLRYEAACRALDQAQAEALGIGIE